MFTFFLIVDTSLTRGNVAQILEYTHTPAELFFCYYISTYVTHIIGENCVNKEEQKNQLVQYYVDFSPYASWSRLGGRLLWLEEYTALEVAKKFIKAKPGLLHVH